MEKRRILLISQPSILGESLENILNSLEDVQVIGSEPMDEWLLTGFADNPPDLVIISDDQVASHFASGMPTRLLEAYPNLTVIQIKLDCNFLQVYNSQAVPARVVDLIDVIRHAPLTGGDPHQTNRNQGVDDA